jgi:hypothetical protein
VASKEQWGYWRGVLLPAIVEGLGVPPGDRKKSADELHENLKTLFEVTSFYRQGNDDMQWVIGYLHVLFAREFGVMLPEPDEPSILTLNRMGMKTFLGLQKDLYAKSIKSDTEQGRV